MTIAALVRLNWRLRNALTYLLTWGCLFGLAVECANARLSTRPGLISCTEPGTNPAPGAKIRSGAYVIRLISWAASEGSTVSSLICDRWLTRKVATFMGLTDSFECRFSIDVRLRLRDWTYSEPARRGRGLALATWGWICKKNATNL